MKNRCAGLAVVLISLFAFSKTNADIEFNGVLEPGTTVTRIDSVSMTPPGSTFLTPGWGSQTPYDTFVFTGVPAWPETLQMYGTINAIPFRMKLLYPDTGRWYHMGSVVGPNVKFYGTGYGGVEESKPPVELRQCLAVCPSVVTGQTTVRLQPAGTARPAVQIHDAAGNVVRSLDCTAGAGGFASATWNREDESGRLVPEGVYFCRHAASDVTAVRKVLVVH